MVDNCLFCKIAAKEIPSNVVYEDKDIIAFLDIKPVNPGHTLVVPKKHSNDISEMKEKDATPLFAVSQKIIAALLKTGYDGANIHVNVKPASGQIVMHTHVHVIPRMRMDGLGQWTGKVYAPSDDKAWTDKLLKALKAK